MQKVHYIDLCSGIGGFRIAINNYSINKLKFECVLSADIKKDAIDTYNLNFNEKYSNQTHHLRGNNWQYKKKKLIPCEKRQ